MLVLVINSGSSSLKFQLIDINARQVLAKGLCERIGPGDGLFKYENIKGAVIREPRSIGTHAVAIHMLLSALKDPEDGVIRSLDEISAVGHRVVHGGPHFSQPAMVNEETKEAIRQCSGWCPLHNQANLTGIEEMEKALPDKPQVAIFDTAFHQTMPPEAYMYGIPYEYYEKYDMRRYGFHGTSHEFVSRRAAKMTRHDPATQRLITCHLGNGSSFAAIRGGRCLDTSMGLTPLEGIMMGTRCGSIDPAIPPFMGKLGNCTPDEIDEVLNKQSGMLGISGVSMDFRDIQAAAAKGHERSILAIKMFCYQAVKIIGSYIAVLGGLDTLVFTAGVGENDEIIREKICDGLSHEGIVIDKELNLIRGKELVLSTGESKVEVFVILTNEELSIAIQTAGLLKNNQRGE